MVAQFWRGRLHLEGSDFFFRRPFRSLRSPKVVSPSKAPPLRYGCVRPVWLPSLPEAGMQLVGAYLIFLLAIVALGLGAILFGVVGIALYEGVVWFRAAHPFNRRGWRTTPAALDSGKLEA